MGEDLLIKILSNGGGGAGYIALTLGLWLWLNHLGDIKQKINAMFKRIDEMKLIDIEQGKLLARYDEKLANMEKRLDRLDKKIFNGGGE